MQRPLTSAQDWVEKCLGYIDGKRCVIPASAVTRHESPRSIIPEQRRGHRYFCRSAHDHQSLNDRDQTSLDYRDRSQLFNLKTDPQQTKNLAAEHREKVEELKKLLSQLEESGRTRPE
jgi:arylsulfatase A-like enzyme